MNQSLTINISPDELILLIETAVGKALMGISTSPPQFPESDRWFDLTEVCEYLPDKPAKATVYGWVNHSTIPCHKGSKKLRFLKSEIDEWLKQGRRKTVEELGTEADTYLKRKRGKHYE